MSMFILVDKDGVYNGPKGLKTKDLVLVRTDVKEQDYLTGIIQSKDGDTFKVKVTGREVEPLKKGMMGKVLKFKNKNLRILNRA